jgi:anti-sigma-K factor RskA
MDVKEFIASGIVEIYAMNALSPDEKKEFERQMVLYPEIKTELKKVEQTLEEYALAHSINPRPLLREQILDKINEGKETVKSKSKNNTGNENYSHTLTYKYLIAASLAALVVSTFASWFFYSRWNEAEDRYTALLIEKNELAQNYNLVKETYDETVSNILVMRDENSSVIILHSTDTTHHYQARVYWNKINRHSYIDVLSLPTPDEGKQFQLWALVGGKPVDAGVFIVGEDGIQRVKDIPDAEVWAVTLEPKGGSVSPTMDQMYLISKNS